MNSNVIKTIVMMKKKKKPLKPSEVPALPITPEINPDEKKEVLSTVKEIEAEQINSEINNTPTPNEITENSE